MNGPIDGREMFTFIFCFSIEHGNAFHRVINEIPKKAKIHLYNLL